MRTTDNRELAKLFSAPPTPRDANSHDPGFRWALCLSGGGIRSASFSLGVIQGLAQRKILDRFDYVSTVSGGGYIGSWLSAWRSRNQYESLEGDLSAKSEDPLDPEAAPVRYLRAYSRYLSPHRGFFTVDAWTLVATILRNLLLNWLVIVPILAAALTVPLFAFAVVAAPTRASDGLAWMIGAFLFAGLVLGAMGVWFVHSRRPDNDVDGGVDQKKAAQSVRSSGQIAFVLRCLLPITLAIALINTAWYWLKTIPHIVEHFAWFPNPASAQIVWYAVGYGAVIHLLGWIASQFYGENEREEIGWKTLWVLAVIIATGGMAGAGAIWAAEHILGWAQNATISGTVSGRIAFLFSDFPPRFLVRSLQPVFYTLLAFPGFLLGLVLAGFLYVGVTSKNRFDGEREWSSRYSAWLLIVIVVWLGLATIVMTSVVVITSVWGIISTVATGLITGGATAVAGYSASSPSKAAKGVDGKPSGQPLVLRVLTAFAVPIAVLAILMVLAAMNAAIIGFFIAKFPSDRLEVIGAYAVALTGLGFWFSRQIDVNKFSLHAMYRSRLIRAYLGASRRLEERHPNPMTGFDSQDNLPMEPLLPGAPLDVRPVPIAQRAPIHVLNMALNLTASTTLAWQDRQARSFTVTPLHAGSWGLGYRRTRAFNDDQEAYFAGAKGIQLGTAMAISGAAASPNMGYHSSKTVTFLMTMFNARLGWWLGNPGWAGRDKFHDANPTVAISPIFRELLGLTSDRHSLVHLSDGGHFENLGLYEMVLRRCRCIVVADASCDLEFAFDDLGSAIRKIRIDFGIPIVFREDPHELKRAVSPTGEPLSQPHRHWATAVIKYSVVDQSQADGLLVYLKPTLGGDEPQDVDAYARTASEFPHEATSDQFFSESQFESYRSLGTHTVDNMFSGEGPGATIVTHHETGAPLV